MSKERATMDFGNFAAIEPRPASNTIPVEEIERRGKEAGFITRHSAPAKRPAPAPMKTAEKVKPVDGRKIRKSKKTTQLNIAVDPELKNRFWALAEELDMDSGGDILAYLIDRHNTAG